MTPSGVFIVASALIAIPATCLADDQAAPASTAVVVLPMQSDTADAADEDSTLTTESPSTVPEKEEIQNW